VTPRPGALVLVVDDEEEVREMVGRLLGDAGFRTKYAADGVSGIERVATDHPDLVVLDVNMPDMSGLEVLEKIRAAPDPPPVVLLTGSEDAETFTKGVGKGAAAYVKKPFRFDELLAACRRVLEASGREAAGPPGPERRREERRPLLAAVTVLSRDKKPLALGELINLSPGGAQVELGVPLEPGSQVWVAFQGLGMALTLECRVQWWQGSASRSVAHGLQFLNLSPEQERPIRELLAPEGG
jgi:DNA-binding response OmpR family regulator